MSTKWRWLTDATWYWKGHVVSDELVHAVEMDLYDRAVADGHNDITFVIAEQTDEVHFDLPGMCLINRSLRAIDLDGLKLRIPSQDFFDILGNVKRLKERTFKIDGKDVTYYKLHGWRFRIVLTVAERERLIADMESQLDAAEVEADNDNKRFVQGIRAAQAAGANVASMKADALEKALDPNKVVN